LFPQVSLSGNVAENYVNTNGYSGNYESHQYQVQVSQQLLNMNALATWRAAKQTSNASDSMYNYQYQQFIQTVTDAYFAVLTAEQNTMSAEAELKAYTYTFQQTKQRFKVGVATVTQLKQAESNSFQGKADVIKAKNALKISIEKLSELTGVKYRKLSSLKKTFPFSSPVPAKQSYWVDLAKEKNMQLNASRATTQSSYDAAVANYSNFLPSVSVVGTYVKNGNTAPITVSGYHNQATSSVQLSLTWNVFSGGANFANASNTAYLYAEQQSLQDNTYRQTIISTKQSYLNVIANASLVAAYKQAVKSGESSVEKLQAEYKVGTTTIVSVLDEVQKLFVAKQNLANAESAYIKSSMQLKLDAGVLSIRDVKAINVWL
jgi:outer membrane protein